LQKFVQQWRNCLVSEGKKYDGEKPRMHLLPPKSMFEVAKVLTFGAEKYDEHNWRKLENLQNRYTSGALRHIFAHNDGEQLDQESELSHLAHAICCLLFKLEIELENGENKKNQKERSRKSVIGEYSTSYKHAPAHFYGSETNNEESSVRDVEYKLQYNPPRYDTVGLSRQTGIRGETEKPKPWKKRKS